MPLARVSGAASGFDVNGLVNELMQAERQPLARLQQRTNDIGEVDSAWQDVASRIQDLRGSSRDLTRDGLESFTTTTSSDEGVATATATGQAQTGATRFTVEQLAAAEQQASATVFADPAEELDAGTVTVDVGGATETVDVADGDTGADVAGALDAVDGVRAQLLDTGAGHRIVVSAEETGADGAFSLDSDVAGLGGWAQLAAAQDAELRLGDTDDAMTITRSSNQIDDVVDGVTLELQGTGDVTVGVEPDDEAAVEAAGEALGSIGETMDLLQQLTNYDADADEAGPLQGETAASRLSADLRAAVGGTVVDGNATYQTPASIGVEIDRNGNFTVDETALTAAYNDDPDEVAALLTGPDGILANVDEIASRADGAAGDIALARERLDNQRGLVDDRIQQFERRLEQREEQYFRQFSAMETAMAELQQQQSQLGMLGGGLI